MPAEWIAAGVAVVVSLLLEVVPGLAEWWEEVAPTWKRLGWLVGCLVLPLVVLGLGCAGLDLGVSAPACNADGVLIALRLGFAAYFAGQATYGVKKAVSR